MERFNNLVKYVGSEAQEIGKILISQSDTYGEAIAEAKENHRISSKTETIEGTSKKICEIICQRMIDELKIQTTHKE